MKEYKKNSISLFGAIGLGTGVMISAGIFALVGQIAELANKWFPLIFIAGSIVALLSAYSYIKFSHHFPSAGGIGHYLMKSFGKGIIASTASLMMIFSMIINQSLVARTFGSYTMELFGGANNTYIIPLLGVFIILFSLIVNLSGNSFIQAFTSIASFVKIIGLVIFSLIALYASQFVIGFSEIGNADTSQTWPYYIASIALAILAFKGFTTITNNGSEIVEPKKNIGRAIIISIAVSLVIYVFIAFAVSGSLSVSEIIRAKDYALAEAARPFFGGFGLWFTVILAIIATITAIIASVFAVSRLIAMLANMEMIPHKKISKNIKTQQQTLFYTVGLAILLTIFFDLTRIASLGALLYITMDMVIHYGLAVKMKDEIKSNKIIIWSAFTLDVIILSAFIYVKLLSDWFIVLIALMMIIVIGFTQTLFMAYQKKQQTED